MSEELGKKLTVKEKHRRNIFLGLSWLIGIAFVLIFTLLLDVPILIALPVFFALISKQFILAMVLTFVRGSGVFGAVDVQMLWIAMTLMSAFCFGLYNFFFNTKKFLKIKRK